MARSVTAATATVPLEQQHNNNNNNNIINKQQYLYSTSTTTRRTATAKFCTNTKITTAQLRKNNNNKNRNNFGRYLINYPATILESTISSYLLLHKILHTFPCYQICYCYPHTHCRRKEDRPFVLG